MEQTQLKSFLESLIFVAEEPLKVSEMVSAISRYEKSLIEAPLSSENPSTEGSTGPEAQLKAMADKESEKISKSDLQTALKEIAEEYSQNSARGILLVEVANGWQFRTRPENAKLLQSFYDPKPTKISKPSLETLSIVAYRQPITRVEIDMIRGVDSGGVLKTLLEKNLVRIVGKKEEAGKPMLYGTTPYFLELFGLKNLQELPTLRELRELEEEFQRKAAEEGVVVENVSEEEDTNLLASLPSLSNILDSEEEEILGDMEASLKEIQKLEGDIFTKPAKEEKADAP
jgi:segregation and condensation protein B